LWVNGSVKFTLDELKKLGEMGAFIEHCYVGFLPTDFRYDPKPMRGPRLSSSAPSTASSVPTWGSIIIPPPAEGMRMFIALLLKNGLSPTEVEFMAKKNSAKLLDLD